MALAAICYPYIPGVQALSWLAVIVSGNLTFFAYERALSRRYPEPTIQIQRAFVRHVAPVHFLLAAAWGMAVLLFFNRVGPDRELACWALLNGVFYLPIARMALVPEILRRHIHTFLICSVGGLFFAASFLWAGDRPAAFWFAPVAIYQWWLARRLGKEIYRTQSEHYSLVFDLDAKNEVAREAVKTKDRFLAAATHDMRQPVTALGLYAEYLATYPETHVELAPKIGKASAAINSLFNSLFDLSNFDSGEVKLTLEPVSIADVIHGLYVAFEPLAAARGLELRVHVVDAVVQTDLMRLRRMIGNVLSNAIKYSQAGGKILLASRVHGGQVRVEVWDQGIGIPADQIQNVFKEFYRVDEGAKLAPDGMGIGLSLVTRLATALNTRLSIASVEGRGTRVTMTIGDVHPDTARPRMSLAMG